MNIIPKSKLLAMILIASFLGSCAIVANNYFDKTYGNATPQQRMVSANSLAGSYYHEEVKPIIEKRCVVCHGCYDAPCQLKLTAAQGIDRGASSETVYDGTRLTPAKTSRLFIDHMHTAQWRQVDFYPVLNERQQTPEINHKAGVMSRLLALKQQNPLATETILPEQYDFSLDREQQCPKAVDMDSYERDFPDWGMPFGLPALSKAEDKIIQDWLLDGAKMAAPAALSTQYTQQVMVWESFLNGDSLKEQLFSRYLYEHWFIAHLYFSALPAGEFFKIVRSSTPPGEPIDLIATRRPYDDPGVKRVYYRLWRERETILEKTHLSYALNNERLETYSQLFLQTEYEVRSLPSYKPTVAANPFKAFADIPTLSRYKFLLEEAQFTIMNFIKSPVCRGQVALNVINDHFWVFFATPQEKHSEKDMAFYYAEQEKLALPSEAESDAYILTNWLKYSDLQNEYMQSKAMAMNKAFPGGEHLTAHTIWDGDGSNTNAALTIFRHIDSASVAKGLLGRPPKTAWVIDYGLLERIHYLLAAGFDVYGNIGHQLNTRLYMDFLRIEGEFNFLALLPPETRKTELKSWYEGVSDSQRKHLMQPHNLFLQPSGIDYKTDQAKLELYEILHDRLSSVLADGNNLSSDKVPRNHRFALDKLQNVVGGATTLLPQITFLTVHSEDSTHYYTILRNNAHRNITSLLNEEANLQPEEDTITVTKGLVGAYPDVFVNVSESQIDEYIEAVLSLRNEKDYRQLLDRYAIRRTDPNFWQHSDSVLASHLKNNPFKAGLFDYNRLQNR